MLEVAWWKGEEIEKQFFEIFFMFVHVLDLFGWKFKVLQWNFIQVYSHGGEDELELYFIMLVNFFYERKNIY